MKKYIRLSFLLLLVLLMSVILLAGCKPNTDESTDESESGLTSLYSEGIDENGFWKGVKALDYVENFNYRGLTIPADVHHVSDDYLQSQIDTLMAGYMSRIETKDRAVADGDTVNINYEGKVDGKEFEGSSTMGVGADVVIGESDDSTQSFSDDFLKQLIGQMPGSTLEIKITFPDDYYVEEVQGKEAMFVTTINYILEREELTDAFVAEKMSESNGWTTVEEMRKGVRASIQKRSVQEYIDQFLRTEVPVKSIPDSIMKYEEKLLLNGHQELADYNGMTLEAYLQEYEGFSSVEECLKDAHDELVGNATCSLALQAVAEDAGISVTDEDLTKYSVEYLWSSDISVQVEQYGLPHVKQVVLGQKVIDYIAENAVLL